MKKIAWILLAALASLLVIFTACDFGNEEPDKPVVPPGGGDITITGGDLKSDFLIGDGNGFVVDLPGISEQLSRYSSVALKVQLYAGDTKIDGANGDAMFKLLSKDAASADWESDEILVHYNLKTGTNTESIPSTATGVPKSLVVIRLDGETITKIEIESITFKAKTSDATFSGSGDLDTDSVTKEVLSVYQEKSDVLKITAASYNWAPVRIDLSDYAEKKVTLTLSVKVWMDQASKIMFQTNADGYPVIGGGDTYEANKWVEITGSKEVTLPAANDSSTPWFYLDNSGLKGGATYYFADFTLNVEE